MKKESLNLLIWTYGFAMFLFVLLPLLFAD